MVTSKKMLKGKKKWFSVLASPEFSETIVGETSAYEGEQLIGRTVSFNLGMIAPELRRQNAIGKFKIKSVQGQNASTIFVSYEISPMLIKRLVKPERDKADDSFVAETSDGMKVKLKTFFVSRSFAHNSVFSAIRMKSRQFLSEEAKKRTYSEFVIVLASGDLQKAMKAELKKILPLAVGEIRAMELIQKK